MISIPNYVIEEKIGAGGMAEVYLAKHKILPRHAAIKVMSANLITDKSFKDSFIKEGQIMAQLKHPHIVEIYDIGVSNDLCYMAIELLEKESLKEKLEKAALPIAETLTIIKQLSSAIQYAHDKNYIHRDIKPANTLFRNNGDAILTDFGISKLQGTVGDLTQMGYLIGSPYYMSPEQIQGQTLDKRSDIYSLGIMFYEMLTGKKPFSGSTTVAITYEHVHADIPILDAEFEQFQPVINQVLQKNKEDRYAEVTDFANALLEANQAGNQVNDESDDETVIFTAKKPQPTQDIPPPQPREKEKTKDEDEEGQVSPATLPVKPPRKTALIIGGTLLTLITLGIASYMFIKPSTTTPITPSTTITTPPKTPISKTTTQIPATTDNNKTQQNSTKDIENDVENNTEKNSQTNSNNSLIIQTLLDNALSNFRSSIKTYIRIQKAEQNIKEYKKLPPDPGRTKFIADRKKAIADFNKQKTDNQHAYCDAVIKLNKYPITDIKLYLQEALVTKYTKPIYEEVGQLLLKHTKIEILTHNQCKNDLIHFAKKLSQTLQ
ncbi:MAG TPA: serine/threonine protein kinase [Thiothrix sp.]|nr:serine/threonine protein kinase [Thiothrix sp.]